MDGLRACSVPLTDGSVDNEIVGWSCIWVLGWSGSIDLDLKPPSLVTKD